MSSIKSSPFHILKKSGSCLKALSYESNQSHSNNIYDEDRNEPSFMTSIKYGLKELIEQAENETSESEDSEYEESTYRNPTLNIRHYEKQQPIPIKSSSSCRTHEYYYRPRQEIIDKSRTIFPVEDEQDDPLEDSMMFQLDM